MRGRAALVLLLTAAASPALAASADYSGSGSNCQLLVNSVGYFSQPVQGCSVSHVGTLTVTPVDCTPSGCSVTASGSATGTASPPGLLALQTLLLWGNTGSRVCFSVPPLPASSTSCTGAATPLHMDVTPGNCTSFSVQSSVYVDHVLNGPVRFIANVRPFFDLCRDAAGDPSITPH